MERLIGNPEPTRLTSDPSPCPPYVPPRPPSRRGRRHLGLPPGRGPPLLLIRFSAAAYSAVRKVLRSFVTHRSSAVGRPRLVHLLLPDWPVRQTGGGLPRRLANATGRSVAARPLRHAPHWPPAGRPTRRGPRRTAITLVSLPASGPRAAATRSSSVTTPGRITREETRCSHASRNNKLGESCSIARASRNSSSSLRSSSPAVRQPRYRATCCRCEERVCSRPPWRASSPTEIRNRSDKRATAAEGAEGTSAGTKPSQGRTHS